MGVQGSYLVWQHPEKGFLGKAHNTPGEGGRCPNAHRGSWRRRTCGRSSLKAELAGGKRLTLAEFGAQEPVEFAAERLQQENPILAHRT